MVQHTYIHKCNTARKKINKQGKQTNRILSIDAEKASNKIQHLFMIKALKKLGKEGVFLNTIKSIYDIPRGNIILNGEQLKP
jgi:hypothetical protein